MNLLEIRMVVSLKDRADDKYILTSVLGGMRFKEGEGVVYFSSEPTDEATVQADWDEGILNPRHTVNSTLAGKIEATAHDLWDTTEEIIEIIEKEK